MAKVASRAAAKSANKPASRIASSSGGSKAQQAARHQSRPEPEPRQQPRREPPQAGERDTQEHTDRLANQRAPAVQTRQVVSAESMEQLPDFMRGDVHADKENIGNEDI